MCKDTASCFGNPAWQQQRGCEAREPGWAWVAKAFLVCHVKEPGVYPVGHWALAETAKRGSEFSLEFYLNLSVAVILRMEWSLGPVRGCDSGPGER